MGFQMTNLFSSNSFNAFAGLWITSPAAIRFTTVASNFWIFPGVFMFDNVYKFLIKSQENENVSNITYGYIITCLLHLLVCV